MTTSIQTRSTDFPNLDNLTYGLYDINTNTFIKTFPGTRRHSMNNSATKRNIAYGANRYDVRVVKAA